MQDKARTQSKKLARLPQLVNCLPSELKELALLKALQAAREIQSERDCASALSDLADKLPSVFPEALQAAREIQSERDRASALSDLADKLPSVFPEALQAAREIQDESSRATALSALADKLPPSLLPQALQAAREIQDESSRATALSALADKPTTLHYYHKHFKPLERFKMSRVAPLH